MVRSSFSILFAIRESKARKSGKAPIEITITVNGERCPLSTGKQVPIDKWDKTKQQVKGKDEKAQSLNNYLKAIKARLYQKEAELLDRGFIITAELLRDAYFDKVESLKEKSLFEVFEEHNNEQEKLVGNGISKATYWISVYTVRLLKEFVQQKYKREDLYLREMRQPRMIFCTLLIEKTEVEKATIPLHLLRFPSIFSLHTSNDYSQFSLKYAINLRPLHMKDVLSLPNITHDDF